MVKKIFEFELDDGPHLKTLSNDYYVLIESCFEGKKKVFDLASGIGKNRTPFTPFGEKKHFISYCKKTDGNLEVNAQFYNVPKKDKVSLKMQVFSNAGEEKLESFIEAFMEGFEKLV